MSALPRRFFYALFFFGGIVCFLSAALTYSYLSYSSVFVGSSWRAAPTPEPKPDEPPPPPVYTFALLGWGGGGHEGGKLTDSIMVIRLDTGTKQATVISVPRDLWVSFPSNGWEEETHWKVNAAYAIGSDDDGYPHKPEEFTGAAGGGALAKYALEKIVGFPINYFVAIDFAGFTRAIDVLDGVTVNVERAFEDPLYPIPGEEKNLCGRPEEELPALTATVSASKLEEYFPCRYELLSFKRGKQEMDGDTALKFVRSRHSPTDGGDFNRARRQRNLMTAVKDRVLALNFVPKAIPFLNTLSSHVAMDIPPALLAELAGQVDELKTYPIIGVALTTDADNVLQYGRGTGGQSIVIPKAGLDQWASVHEWIGVTVASEAARLKEASVATPSASPVVVQ
jgi:anionic cell wall polymer biosynthesis LytR-Cps2A-Psr (LCP) family protein